LRLAGGVGPPPRRPLPLRAAAAAARDPADSRRGRDRRPRARAARRPRGRRDARRARRVSLGRRALRPDGPRARRREVPRARRTRADGPRGVPGMKRIALLRRRSLLRGSLAAAGAAAAARLLPLSATFVRASAARAAGPPRFLVLVRLLGGN